MIHHIDDTNYGKEKEGHSAWLILCLRVVEAVERYRTFAVEKKNERLAKSEYQTKKDATKKEPKK